MNVEQTQPRFLIIPRGSNLVKFDTASLPAVIAKILVKEDPISAVSAWADGEPTSDLAGKTIIPVAAKEEDLPGLPGNPPVYWVLQVAAGNPEAVEEGVELSSLDEFVFTGKPFLVAALEFSEKLLPERPTLM